MYHVLLAFENIEGDKNGFSSPPTYVNEAKDVIHRSLQRVSHDTPFKNDNTYSLNSSGRSTLDRCAVASNILS